MSREFGSHNAGYFHQQIESAAEDCLKGKDDLTKLWGEFLKEFSHVAYAISTSEACDSGPDYPIIETIRRWEGLAQRFHRVAEYIHPFHKVMEEAIASKIKR
jgi:hypothetical protein